MVVQMKNALPCVGAGIDDHAKPRVGDSPLARQPRRDLKDLADQRAVLGLDIEHARDVLARNQKNMDGRLRPDVGESDDTLVLINRVGLDLPLRDTAKQTTIHERSSRWRLPRTHSSAP